MKSKSDAPDADELRDVLDAVPDLVATFDRDHRLLFLNASGCGMLRESDPEAGASQDFRGSSPLKRK